MSRRQAPSRELAAQERHQWRDDVDIASLSTAAPHRWHVESTSLPKNLFRQLLGLNPFKTSYFALFRPLTDWQSRFILLAGVLLAIAGGIPLPIIGVIFGKLINSFPPSEEELRVHISQLLGVAVAYFVVTWGWAVCWGLVGERVSRRIREQLVERAMGMEMAYFEVECPDIANRLTADTQTIQLGTSEKVGLFIQSASYFVAAFVVGLILNAKLAGILFAAVIPSMAIIVCGGTTLVSTYSKKASSFTEKAASLAEGAIRAVQVVQAFNASDTLSNKHVDMLSLSIRAGIRKAMCGALMLGSVYFVAYAANGLAFWEGSQMVASNSSKGGAGTVYAVVFLMLDAAFVIGSFGPFLQTFALAASSGAKAFAILDHPEPHINVYSNDGIRADAGTFKGQISFDHVTFVYPARPATRVLETINLNFKPGAMTGIVGTSGSGKSTVASLLLRFYDPCSGRITIGGEDLRNFHIPSLRAQIALVDQESVVFSGTILDNISQGLGDDHGLSEQEVLERCHQAARDANAYAFINDLPEGFQTRVGAAGGTKLSGGQKQRLCLARALIGQPSLLILDEPTSALDATSEKLVLDALNRAAHVSGRTTIMITHRLATVKDADTIMIMHHGRLVEQGTHQELMSRDSSYKELVNAQSLVEFDSIPEDDGLIQALPEELPSEKAVHEHAVPVAQAPSKKENTLSAFGIIKRCLKLSKPEAFFIGVGICASIVGGGMIIGEALVFGHLVQTLNDNANPIVVKDHADFYCLMFFVLSIIALVAHSVGSSSFGVVSENLVGRTRDLSLRAILRQDMSWFSEPGHSSHSLMSTLNMDSGHLSGLSGVIIGTVFSVTTSIVGGIILAHIVAWKIAIVLLAAVPIMIVSGFMRLRILAKFEELHETAYNDAAALASEACQGMRAVQALGREKDILRLYKKAIEGPYKKSLRFIVFGNLLLAFALAITYFVYSLAYWWGSRNVRNGDYSTLDFFIVLPALLFSAQGAGQLFSLAPELTRARSAALSVFALHDQKPSIDNGHLGGAFDKTDNEKAVSVRSGRSASMSADQMSPRRGAVEFRHVSLAYANRGGKYAVKDVDLRLSPGEFVALVGPSGAGKSSAVSLLERFFDPTSGSIFVDGEDIRSKSVSDHRKRLALVPQEPDLFTGSVFFNISLGLRPGQRATREEIEDTCKKCGVHDFVMGLPDGYNTECGLNGSQLSGGQKQRIAIARALVRDPDILLLDEATSALDSHSEAEMQKAIAMAASERTTIVVAHRLASIQNADRIFVFDHGRVVEQGKHAELIALNGVYAAMVKAQALA
ncbi:leptomycin B resistance protein pmd1 [Xylona heveae TC161]|uniref:Leptomycin B resistance protein pmd1 n=1 Tax=Xylona heveae (strain CBS 132557 / TC161) TaxID=1328760 RepID=A0A164ZXW8_XYLHT|nr:leptomycin B resistance protein pmd1 [Xylona heveae TC161]KZF19679.1 leptomycin B resistance protein pmd1 [Xylona heveae TC161]